MGVLQDNKRTCESHHFSVVVYVTRKGKLPDADRCDSIMLPRHLSFDVIQSMRKPRSASWCGACFAFGAAPEIGLPTVAGGLQI